MADNDVLLAFVKARWGGSTPSGTPITAPAGWTQIAQASGADSESSTAYLEVWQKNTVTSADASASFTFNRDGTGRIGATIACVRGGSVAAATAQYSDSDPKTPPIATASFNGAMLLMACGPITTGSYSVSPTPPSGATLWTGASNTFYEISGAYQARDQGQANSGSFSHDGESSHHLTATVRIEANVPAEGTLSAPSPLGVASALGVAYAAGYVAAGTVLGVPSVLARLPGFGWVSAPAILGACRVLTLHDFTGQVGDVVTRYVMDLVTPTGTVRVPISSWQATLQTGRSNYVQCVVPAVLTWVTAINAATEFVISRTATLPDDTVIEYEMARAPVGEARFDRGAGRYTCTLSGYSTGFAVDEEPDPSTDRVLAKVRSVSTGSGGLRVRCAVDWLLRPGQRAIVDGSPFTVAYINYYVNNGDAYMDVGERG